VRRARSCSRTPRATRTIASTAAAITRRVTLVVGDSKRIETIALPISIGGWRYSRIRVIGDVVGSITEP